MNLHEYDVVVIGSGPGGFSAAVRAAQIGAKVAIIERLFIGGTCLNCGCIPTKFLWKSLKVKKEIQGSYRYGIKSILEPIVFENIINKKNKNITSIRSGMKIILSSYNINIFEGSAIFKNKNVLIISNNEKNEKFEIYADKIIIASGTKPLIKNGFTFDGVRIINSTDALNLKKIPKNMLIIGGGVVGIEMATIFSGFGCHVTLVERANFLLPNEDYEISEEISKNLSRQGIEVITACTNAFDDIGEYEKILIAIGRVPNDGLNLRDLGINITDSGFIKTNEFCQTNISNIYSVGDITGKNLLAYSAQHEGVVAAENIIKGNKFSISNFAIPQVIFAMPQSASVKVLDFEKYKNVIFGKFPFASSGRAFIENERTGFVKCGIDKLTKKPLAFWIIGAYSDEIINTASQILKSGMGHISRETMFHPSFSESLLNAYEDAFGKCVDVIKK
ncbi:MAG: NAD(P)/FAD-dependent oxidoreductase [Endomicrobium sp.]|jgi:dihydrolipoamide dehydrogenase|nr:NAD(P)/FAD-dependent oxidoreductase [Endomicrobium sp.]